MEYTGISASSGYALGQAFLLQDQQIQVVKSKVPKEHLNSKRVAMCGEMAGNLTALPILLGLGLDEFSMSASSVLPARALVSQLSLQKERAIAEAVLEMDNPLEIESFVKQAM